MDIYTASVTQVYLNSLKMVETPVVGGLEIIKTRLQFAKTGVGAELEFSEYHNTVTTALRFIMASISKITVLKEMYNPAPGEQLSKRKTRSVPAMAKPTQHPRVTQLSRR